MHTVSSLRFFTTAGRLSRRSFALTLAALFGVAGSSGFGTFLWGGCVLSIVTSAPEAKDGAKNAPPLRAIAVKSAKDGRENFLLDIRFLLLGL